MENEIPSDADVMDALASKPEGLTPEEIIEFFEDAHALTDIIEAIQRVMDRGKVVLAQGGRLRARHEQAMQVAA